MRQVVKTVVLLITATMLIAIVGPFFMGIYLQKKQSAIFALYQTLPGIQIQQTHYQRGWFHSKAEVTIDISHPGYENLLRQLGINPRDIPHHYTFNQYIQHGPLLYNSRAKFPFQAGVALIQNVLQPTPEVQTFLSHFSGTVPLIQTNQIVISFRGNYFHHLTLVAINISCPAVNTFLKINRLESRIGFNPAKQSMQGDLTMQEVRGETLGDFITLPNVHYVFYAYPGDYHLWLGHSTLTLPQLTATEIDGPKIVLQDVAYQSATTMTAGQLDSSRQIGIGQLHWDGRLLMAPFHLQISIHRINAQALTHLFETYRTIRERGELYPSQLRNNMESLLPTLVSSGSSVTLDRLEVKTPTGALTMHGQLRWDMDNSAIPEDFFEWLTAANATLDARISKTLLNDLIDFYVTSPLLDDMGWEEEEEAINEANTAIYYNMQMNTLLINALMEGGRLREVDAEELLALQKNMAPIEEYADHITHLLLNKYLTLSTSYWLYWGYLSVEHAIGAVEKMIVDNQRAAKAAINAQIDSLLNAGYITDDKNDYVISLIQDQGKIKAEDKTNRSHPAR